MSPYKPNGTPAAILNAEIARQRDLEPTIGRCAFCPQWQVEGTAGECRTAAASHRAKAHPQLKGQRRRRRGSLKRFIDPDPSYRAGGLAAAAEVARMHARRDAA